MKRKPVNQIIAELKLHLENGKPLSGRALVAYLVAALEDLEGKRAA